MSYAVFVVEEHSTNKDLHCESQEHYFEYADLHKALAHFNFLAENFEWVELRDLDNKGDSLLHIGGSQFSYE